MTNAVLRVSGLSKRYGNGERQTQALNDIEFTLQAGETLGITGPSGCGKTTLARCIMRLIEPDSGIISVDGTDWSNLSAGALRQRRRDMQMVFQNSSESFTRFSTVGGVISDPLRIHSVVEKNQRLAEVEKLLATVGLSADLLTRRISQLSGGQRQRVAIARALASRPKILVLDEAVSALDMIARRTILELIQSLQQERQLSVLFISHDLAAIRAICHRAMVMDSGKIIEEGDTTALISQPQTELVRSLLNAVPRLDL
jgi:peptide/nickel transport system ATP-binding protein